MIRVLAWPTALLLVSTFAASQTPTASSAQQTDAAAFQQQLETGKTLFHQHKYDEALKSFRAANDMRDKKCAVCYSWMTDAYLSLEAYKNVISAADKAVALAPNDLQLLIRVYNNKGLALQAQADKKDEEKLKAAEAVFRLALALPNPPGILHYNLGVTLLQQNLDEQGIAELKQYVQMQPKGSYVALAHKLIDNARRARENYAPDFAFTSLDGDYVSLDDLRGKVIVLDFWATWCGPCTASVPDLRNLRRKYATNQSFVMIGISADFDEAAWRTFTEQNKMLWVHYRDEDFKIQRAFAIHAYPTYIVIDHEGILRYEGIGAGYRTGINLEDAVRKQLMIASKSAAVR
jgi:thiol-disulfide isomerase/thioredoxin